MNDCARDAEGGEAGRPAPAVTLTGLAEAANPDAHRYAEAAYCAAFEAAAGEATADAVFGAVADAKWAAEGEDGPRPRWYGVRACQLRRSGLGWWPQRSV